ncbi:single-stranded-DNA-specific exonuclease RecJ [Candidatus Microgenomates bacterium]|nr:single-stranded-DNA-specific exonuclease RecJ [Candidatus Microgenomates bacterium]
MSTKKWEILSKGTRDRVQGTVEEIKKILLRNRGIKTKLQEKEFFNPTHPDKLKALNFGIDPKELKKSVVRIKKAKESGEKVIVWGDYDADGICGAAILWEALYYSGVNALPFIPERRTEGYGLNVARMKQLKKEDPSVGLIITVDNGIVAHEKVDTAKELGVDVIITDHHLPRKTKPKAYAILHTTKICGATVAYILARELASKGDAFQGWQDHLGLAALAQIADMVPLVGQGRSIVYHGLPMLQKTNRMGIIALCNVAKINQASIGTYEVGFMLAPRLNAAGRIENALSSLRLLCTKKRIQAQELAEQLQKTNASRQQMVLDTVTHAREQVIAGTANLPAQAGGLIFVAHESYHEGIVGLVASRLVEEFGRPAFVVAKGEELSRGSARSVPGFNIVQLIETSREFLVEGGGHSMAAGFSVKTTMIEHLQKAFLKNSKGMFNDGVGRKVLIDCEIPLEVINFDLVGEIEKFEPFGIGNPQPTFATRKVVVDDARLIGSDGKHLKLSFHLSGGRLKIDAVAFGMGELYSHLSPGKLVDIAYTVDVDRWNGREKLQLKLKDLIT